MLGPRSARAARRAELIASRSGPAAYSSSSSSPCNAGSAKPLAIRPDNGSAADVKQKGRATSSGAEGLPRLGRPRAMSMLAQRRASLLAQPAARRLASPSTRSTRPPAPSSAAAHILNPDAFRPVHLYPGQIALHVSFTPPHMPLPVHLGTGRYKSTRYKALLADDPFQVIKGPSPGGVLQSMAAGKGSTLGQHLGVTTLLDQPEHAKHLLPEHADALRSPAPANPFLAPTSQADELDFEVDFQRMMTHNQTRSTAAQNWSNVLGKINAAAASAASTSTAEISDAVADIAAMLARMNVQESTMQAAHRARTRVWTKTSSRPVAFHRQGRGADVRVARMTVRAEADGVHMDSVKRKRKKKISKHKYKKRRKATRSERKRLGK